MKIPSLSSLRRLIHRGRQVQEGAAYETALAAILSRAPSNDPKCLLRYGAKVYSQTDEDGIIAEIFRRIGTTSKTFLEIGVGDGAQNNSVALLLQGWSGTWIDGNPDFVRTINEQRRDEIARGRLAVKEMFVEPESAAEISALPQWPELDLFSLDIDGNDFHVLSRMPLKARVVIVEYNARFAPPIDWVMAYRRGHGWDGSDYFGASLSAFTNLMKAKGYSLVGCNVSGVNAFFVRDDLVGDLFQAPFTAEHHFQPARYWMATAQPDAHPVRFGPATTSGEV